MCYQTDHHLWGQASQTFIPEWLCCLMSPSPLRTGCLSWHFVLSLRSLRKGWPYLRNTTHRTPTSEQKAHFCIWQQIQRRLNSAHSGPAVGSNLSGEEQETRLFLTHRWRSVAARCNCTVWWNHWKGKGMWAALGKLLLQVNSVHQTLKKKLNRKMTKKQTNRKVSHTKIEKDFYLSSTGFNGWRSDGNKHGHSCTGCPLVWVYL